MRNIVLKWGDVKERLNRSLVRGERWDSQPVMGTTLADMHRVPYDKTRNVKWQGGNGAEVMQGLRDGYRAKEFENSAEYVPSALRHTAAWQDEDGDVDVGRMAGGYDDFMLGMAERPTKPGIRVQFEYAFACGVSNEVIAQYGAWIAGLLGSMEQNGFDMVVDAWIPLDNLYVGDRWIRSNILIRVKQANETSDFTEWSPLFAPYGYRVIGFTSKCVAGDKIGKTANHSLGTTIGGKTWGLIYDPDTAVVRITCNQRAGGWEAFPGEKLTKLAIEAGLIPDPNMNAEDEGFC